MKFDVCLPCFFRKVEFCDAVRQAAALGVKYVETYHWEQMDIETVKKTLKETGVELVTLCVTEFNMTDPAYREKWLKSLADSCEAAHKLGVKILISQAGPNNYGVERAIQHATLVETLKMALPILEKYKITLCLEPVFDLTNFLVYSRDAFYIVREVNSPYVKILYDIGHQQVTEGNIINNILNNLEWIGHFHAAGQPGRAEMHTCELNYKFIFDTIDKAGYTGACGLEFNPKLDPIESLKETMRIYF